tara:strand:+ start:298 stop:558 length:261 start_codon:yes stop_codon:yes gene_type:complete
MSYYDKQCTIFAKNYKEQGRVDNIGGITKGEEISFNKQLIKKPFFNDEKYSINLGPTQYHSELKRFNSKEEMLGYVSGYNTAKGWC